MHIKFTPNVCMPGADGAPALYAGEITLRAPGFDERQSFYDEAQEYAVEKAVAAFDGAEGEAVSPLEVDDEKSKKEAVRQLMKVSRQVARRIPEFFVTSTVTRLEDGFVFSEWGHFWHDSDMVATVHEVVAKLVGKYSAGPQ